MSPKPPATPRPRNKQAGPRSNATASPTGPGAGHAAREHARMSPSSAYRWLACPGSIALIESLDLPEGKPNPSMERGTAHHELFEKCMKLGSPARRFAGMLFNGMPADAKMVAAVQLALDSVAHATPGARIYTETRLDIPQTGEHGTADLVIVRPNGLRVLDLKAGTHAVDPTDNPQLKLYGLGALARWPIVGPVILGTIMPNSRPEKPLAEWETSPKKLQAWGRDIVAPVAKQIREGTAKCIAGPHCKEPFQCPAAGHCRTLAEYGARAARMDFADFIDAREALAEVAPASLSDDELAGLLARLPALGALITGARAAAIIRLAAKPTALPGWKLVRGTTHRRWKDAEKTIARLSAAGYDLDEVAPRSLAGLGAVAELLPTKVREKFMNAHTIKPEGRPTLAPEGDKRPPVASNAAHDFAEEIAAALSDTDY